MNKCSILHHRNCGERLGVETNANRQFLQQQLWDFTTRKPGRFWPPMGWNGMNHWGFLMGWNWHRPVKYFGIQRWTSLGTIWCDQWPRKIHRFFFDARCDHSNRHMVSFFGDHGTKNYPWTNKIWIILKWFCARRYRDNGHNMKQGSDMEKHVCSTIADVPQF